MDGEAQQQRVELHVRARTVWTVALHLVVLWALLRAVAEARTVLSWIAVALFLALAANPPVKWLSRRGLKRGWAIALVAVAALALVGLMVATVGPMLVGQARALLQNAPDYLDQLQHQPWVERLDQRFNVVDRATAELRARAPSVAGPVLGVVTGVLSRVAAFVTVFILALFFLAFGGSLRDALLLWLEPGRRAHWRTLIGRMHKSVGGYVAGAFLISFIGGTVTAIVTASLGVPYFLPLGLVMMVLGVVPWVGSALGAVLVVTTTLASQGSRAALIALGIFMLYQQVEGHLLQPLIQRHTLQMNPLIIALVMLVASSLFGILGALLALPVSGAVQVVAQDALARRQARWRAEGRAHAADAAPPPTNDGHDEAHAPH